MIPPKGSRPRGRASPNFRLLKVIRALKLNELENMEKLLREGGLGKLEDKCRQDAQILKTEIERIQAILERG
ncbi:MAG: hypothetical protein HY006_00015 [Candidatus Sungbacteria bacterium]|nr:hypothetical protein [Candidatus Sungbacteria bacterium]